MAPDPRTRVPHSQGGAIGRASRSRAFARGLGRAGLTGSVRSPPCPGFLRGHSVHRPVAPPISAGSGRCESKPRPRGRRSSSSTLEVPPPPEPLAEPPGTGRDSPSTSSGASAEGPSVQESSLGVVRSGLRDPTRNARTECEGRAGDTQGDCMSPRGRVPSAIRPSPPAMPPESRHALSAQAQPHQEAPQGRVPGPHENEQGPPDHQPSTPHRPSSGHDLLSRPHQPHRSHRRPAAHRGGVLSFGARTPIEPTDAP